MKFQPKTLIGITGAQGVGKTTFGVKFAEALEASTGQPVRFLPSTLSAEMAKLGVSFGDSSTSQSVLAIYQYHIRRERQCQSGISILDRCAIDALAYVRSLSLTSDVETGLLEDVSRLLFRSMDFVICLQMSGVFSTSSATHEGPVLRNKIAISICDIIRDFQIPSITVNAADDDAVQRAIAALP